MNNLERSDKTIVVAATLCALLLFSWLIYDIAFLNPMLKGQVEIGEIYQTRNKVKRKFNKSLIWYAVDQHETVYENDWIFTGSGAIAKIKLKSGGEIVIEPDSLIVLSRKNGLLELNLQHGRLMAKVKKKDIKIKVVRNGESQTVDTSKGIVKITQTEDATVANVEVIEPEIIDESGEKELSLGELVEKEYFEPKEGFSKLDGNGITYDLEYHKERSLFAGQKTTAEFHFTDPMKTWDSYELEITTDPEFKKIQQSASTETEGFNITVEKSVDYHWRVRGLDAGGQKSTWSPSLLSTVKINHLEKAPALSFSQNEIEYQIERSELEVMGADKIHKPTVERPVKLSWQPAPEAKKYKVQTSDTADFSNIIEEKIIDANEIKLENIKLGKTHFRVTPEDNNGFVVGEESKGVVQSFMPAPRSESLKTIDQGVSQVMTWEEVPKAEAYEVTYTNKKGSNKQTKQIVTSNQLEVDNSTGFLQWKVRVVDPATQSKLSHFSDTVDWYDRAKRLASIHGAGQAGADYPVITKPEPRKTFISVNNSPLFIVMNWKYKKNAQAYFVEISKTPKMDNMVYNKKVSGKRRAVINQKFKPGVYYMRVRAAHEDVTQESWSETEVFRVIDRNLK